MRLTIIGASGHGRVVADIARLNGYDQIQFLDDDPTVLSCGGYPVVGTTADAIGMDCDLFVAVGNASNRQKLMMQCSEQNLVTLVHPKAVIAESATIGLGTVIMAGAVINPDTKVGTGCIVNTSASIDHDCVIGNFVHVAVGAHLCGTVIVGQETWIGAGSTVINNTCICSNVMIGAGTLVINDIMYPGTYVGSPARRLSKTQV